MKPHKKGKLIKRFPVDTFTIEDVMDYVDRLRESHIKGIHIRPRYKGLLEEGAGDVWAWEVVKRKVRG